MVKINDNNIYLTRGDTVTFDIDLTDEDDNPYIMSSDEYIVFSLRRLYAKGEVLLTIQSDTPSFSITTNDTKNLTFGKYKYDIYLMNETDGMLNTFIADREFYIGEEVHEFE